MKKGVEVRRSTIEKAGPKKGGDLSELDSVIATLLDAYDLSYSEIVEYLQKKQSVEITIPSVLFTLRAFTPLQILALYLIDVKKLQLATIKVLLRKSASSIAKAYNEARTKPLNFNDMVMPFVAHNQPDTYELPLTIFDCPESIFECIVKYLKEEKKLKYGTIGKVLNRDARTVWTAYQRVRQKSLKGETHG